jgi:hypothetical protein
MEKGVNLHFIGSAAELYVAYRASEKNFIVSYPLFTQSKYDLIIDAGGKPLKIQVKKATKNSTNGYKFIQVRLGGCGRPTYTKDDYDYLAIVYEEKLWMLPYEVTKDHTTMSFSIFSEGANRLDNYTWEKFVEKEDHTN